MDCPGDRAGRFSARWRRVLRQSRQPDLYRGNSRREPEPPGRLRRPRIAGPRRLGRPRRIHVGVAVSAARLRALDHRTARACGDNAHRRVVRLDRTARHRPRFPDDHPRAVSGPVGYGLPVDGSHRGRQGAFRTHAAGAVRDQSRSTGSVLLFFARGDLHRPLADGSIRQFAFRRLAARQPRRATPHERTRSQRLAGALDHFRLLGLLGRGRGPPVRLLPQVHSPDDAVADELGGSAARRDRWRGGNDRRADRRGDDRRDPEELRVGLSRALEHAARAGLCR